jgi:cobalt-zinc-cadmium efflux system membrane fusion protein
MTARATRLLLALVLMATGLSCRGQRPSPAGDPAAAEGSTSDRAGAPEAPASGHPRGEDHEGEPSDLDRPIRELTSATCEHSKRTYECDECRYEVGFVRAPATLVREGLLVTTHPTRRTVATPISLTGEVRFDERRVGHVSTQVEGLIRKVSVALGDRVAKGAALVEIESVAVGEDQALSREAEGLLALTRQSFERVAQLRRENIASEKEYLQAQQELQAAEIRANSARAKLTRLGTGGSAGGRVVLRAPLDGMVLMMHAVSGELARTDQPLLTVGDNAAVWVWADLYERDLAAVLRERGDKPLAATVSVKAYPGEEFPGTVDLVSPAMDEATRTVKVRVQVDNPDGRLLAGMFATVQIYLPGSEETTVLPKAAVLSDEGRSFVFVHHQGDYYVRRPVETGRRWADWVEIRRGVEASQTVVSDGAFLMKSDVLRSKMGAGCAD